MLDIVTDPIEIYDENANLFTTVPSQHLQLEHSLISLTKWEAKWKIPFLAHNDKTDEQLNDYIRCMTINRGVDPRIYSALSRSDIDKISDYINDPHTATTFSSNRASKSSLGRQPVVTSEIIYYDMIQFGIPFECEKWHLGRLLTLIHVCSIKEMARSGKKMSKAETAKRYAQLNAERKARYHTKG